MICIMESRNDGRSQWRILLILPSVDLIIIP